MGLRTAAREMERLVRRLVVLTRELFDTRAPIRHWNEMED